MRLFKGFHILFAPKHPRRRERISLSGTELGPFRDFRDSPHRRFHSLQELWDLVTRIKRCAVSGSYRLPLTVGMLRWLITLSDRMIRRTYFRLRWVCHCRNFRSRMLRPVSLSLRGPVESRGSYTLAEFNTATGERLAKIICLASVNFLSCLIASTRCNTWASL